MLLPLLMETRIYRAIGLIWEAISSRPNKKPIAGGQAGTIVIIWHAGYLCQKKNARTEQSCY